jgi:hypothetical protein
MDAILYIQTAREELDEEAKSILLLKKGQYRIYKQLEKS